APAEIGAVCSAGSGAEGDGILAAGRDQAASGALPPGCWGCEGEGPNWAAASWAVAGRSAGFLASKRVMSTASQSGTSALTSRIGRGGSSQTRLSTASVES